MKEAGLYDVIRGMDVVENNKVAGIFKKYIAFRSQEAVLEGFEFLPSCNEATEPS